MSSQAKSGVQPSVRFSRVLGLHSAVALGASISVGLGVYVLLGLLVQVAGRQAVGAPYIFMALLALPIILTYAERAAVIPGSGGAYKLARVSGNVPLTFASGWLLLAGYASLAAILGWGVALHVNVLTEYLFEVSLDLPLLAAAIIGIMALNSTLGSRGIRRSTRTYIYAALLFLFLMIPLPQALVNVIAFPLQLVAADLAVNSLYALEIPALREGNIIHLASTELFVAEACSGLRSLMALGTLGVVFAYFFRRDYIERGLIVLSTIPVAIVVNAFRVALTGFPARATSSCTQSSRQRTPISRSESGGGLSSSLINDSASILR